MWVVPGLFSVCLFSLWWTCRADVQATKLQQAVNHFSIDLLKELSGDEPENLVVSPVSVSVLLALLNQGARLNSSTQLESVLHLTQAESKEGYGLLARQLKEYHNTTAILEVANRLFVAQGDELKPEFRDVAVQDFQSGVEQVTFGSGEGATAINNWVSQATHGRIPSIVESSLDPNTVLVLANAIFFKSPWANRFSEYFTTNETFYSSPGREFSVPTMHHHSELFKAGIDEERDLKWVQLPFQDGGYSMVIVVPNQKYGLAGLLRNFNKETLGNLLEAGSFRDVTLHLPRFKLSSEINLKDPLKELGAKDIFDINASDLSGITTSPIRIYVSKAIQKADIEVDEEGATAAAATVFEGVNFGDRSPINPVTITADHPFLAVLLDDTRTLPLFMATVVEPSGL